jgi:hypothetical protein
VIRCISLQAPHIQQVKMRRQRECCQREPLYASYNFISANNLSRWGQGTYGPSAWKDAGCAHPSLEGIKMVRDNPSLLGGPFSLHC